MVEGDIPNNVIQFLLDFDSNKWNLVTSEVRKDTGKFVNATWEMVIDNNKYWVTIGFGDVIQTIIREDSEGLGYDIVKEGSLYEFVSMVNEQLMDQEKV
jgi:hypothetical protein